MFFDLSKIIPNRFMSLQSVDNGIYKYYASGDDPWFEIPLNGKDGLKFNQLSITLMAKQGEIIELYYCSDVKSPYDNSKKVVQKLKTGEFIEYSFDLSDKAVKKLRIDPCNKEGLLELLKIELSYNNSKKINVGCGPKDKKVGWINVDIQKFNTVDRVMDVTKEWPFSDVDFIFAEHFIEHLRLQQCIDFLINAGKSMKTGGIIRLSTPNIEWVLKKQYNLNDRSDKALMDGIFTINRAFYGWGHQFLYSEFFLHSVLKAVGFDNIKQVKYCESEVAELRNLEQHGQPSYFEGYCNLIVVEAQKTGALVTDYQFLEQAQENFIKYNNAKG